MDNYMIDLNNMSPEEMELAEQKIAEKKYEQLKRRIEDIFKMIHIYPK